MIDKCLEQKIKKMAWKYILSPKSSQKDIGERFGVSSTTVSKYFKKYLEEISPFLYKRVQKKAVKSKLAQQTAFAKKYSKSK